MTEPSPKPKTPASIAEERARRWQSENQAAIASSNEFVERQGLPLARYRQF